MEIYSNCHPTRFKKPPSPIDGTLFEHFGVALYSGSGLCCVFVQAEFRGWSFIRNTFLRSQGWPSIVGYNLMICFGIILSNTIGLPEPKKVEVNCENPDGEEGVGAHLKLKEFTSRALQC